MRFLCSTNRELAQEVAERRFRLDLFFRIDGVTLRLPPLRDRKSMIARLAIQFAGNVGATLATDAMPALEAHDWPCLLYTSDAADERSSVDLGGRRTIQKTTSVLTQLQNSRA